MRTISAALLFGLALAGTSVAAPGAQPPVYPFNIQRSVEPGAAFSAAKGGVFYAETSAGSPGTFVLDTARADDWPIVIEPVDVLNKAAAHLSDRSFWGVKKQKVDFYCPEKFGDFAKASSRIEGYPTICLVDTDQDQTFDSAVRAYSFSTFAMGYMTFRDQAEKITPVAYAVRTHHPDAGKEAIVELRFDGLKGDVIRLTVLARSADSSTAVYAKQIEVPRAAATAFAIEHPFLGSPGFRRALGHDRPAPSPLSEGAKPPPVSAPPRPIPTMTIAITKVDAKSVSGSVVSAFPDWVWHRTTCQPIRLPLGKGEKATETALPAAAPPAQPTICEGATWRDGTTLISTSPASADGLMRTTTMSNEKPKP
ncbi:MAG: hypothetical protein HOP13_08260 [Alphaproteobacteria bacterium]|nr:hypothetical protein [Alphaproteobacteria bacterium]